MLSVSVVPKDVRSLFHIDYSPYINLFVWSNITENTLDDTSLNTTALSNPGPGQY